MIVSHKNKNLTAFVIDDLAKAVFGNVDFK